MKIKLLIIVFLVTYMVADDSKNEKTAEVQAQVEERNLVGQIKERSLARTDSRESSFVSFKIDSSKNTGQLYEKLKTKGSELLLSSLKIIENNNFI